MQPADILPKDSLIRKGSISALIIVLMTCLVSPVKPQVSLGITGGVNFATYRGKETNGTQIDFSSRSGFALGAILEFGINQTFGIRLQPMYLQKGAQWQIDDSEYGRTTLTSKIAYFETPLFLKLTLSASNIRPYLMAGPTVGLNLNSKTDFSGTGPGPALGIRNADADDVTNSVDFGFGFGAGLSLSADKNTIFIEMCYTQGLTDIAKAGTIEQAGVRGFQANVEETDIKTRELRVLLGVLFPLDGK